MQYSTWSWDFIAIVWKVPTRGLHWVWGPAGAANHAGAGGFTSAAGGSGWSENLAGDRLADKPDPDNVLQWWKLSKECFPVLSKCARFLF